ncbi:hypothetical protein OHA70_23030 [Kribbella sp. NBC_00382]|uniref:hypothetical protein n=1 Tax=Kribbella sp. NBC_00382 TaxID=2975967 RepID=UPI002E1D229A
MSQFGEVHGVPVAEGHERPAGVDDLTVEAVGKLTEALETVIRARGQLYAFHQLTGSADLQLDKAVEFLRTAGHTALADRISTELIGRNVISGRWTFQLVEEYDDNYYDLFTQLEKTARDQLTGGRRHLAEAEMKQRRVSPDQPGHEIDPGE